MEPGIGTFESDTDHRVVVVDDEPGVAESTALMLEERGLETVVETDPRRVPNAVGDRVACVVSDYRMPGLDGLELLAEVRADQPDFPFVLFTGRGSEEIASEAIAAGVDYYLQKGKTEQYDRLANAVETAVENYHTERVLDAQRRLLETIYETAFDGIFVLDVDEGVVVDANPRACELLDYPYEELVGTDIASIHPDDYEEYLAVGRDLLDTGERQRVESVCYTRTDEAVPSDITAAPMEYEGETYLLTIMRPQSDR